MKRSAWPARLCLLLLFVALVALVQLQPVAADISADKDNDVEEDEFEAGGVGAAEEEELEEDMEDVGDVDAEEEDEDDELVDLTVDEDAELDAQEASQQEAPQHVHLVPYILGKDITPGETLFVEIGETITVLCAVLNDGEVPIRVDRIGGVLNTVDMQYSLQNLTAPDFNKVIEASDEATFTVDVKVRDKRDGVQALVLLAVYYEEADEPYSRLFMNQTIELIEASDSESSMWFTYAVAAGGAALVGVILLSVLRGLSSTEPVETGTQGGGFQGKEWTDNYNMPQASGLRKRK